MGLCRDGDYVWYVDDIERPPIDRVHLNPVEEKLTPRDRIEEIWFVDQNNWLRLNLSRRVVQWMRKGQLREETYAELQDVAGVVRSMEPSCVVCPACVPREDDGWTSVEQAWVMVPELFCDSCRNETDNQAILFPDSAWAKRIRVVRDHAHHWRVVVEELDGDRETSACDLDGDAIDECSGWTWPRKVPAWVRQAVENTWK